MHEARKAGDRKLAERHDVDPSFAEAYAELEKSVEPYRRQLGAVFEGFMKSIEARMERFFVNGFRSGKVDVEQFARKYGAELAEERYEDIPWNNLLVHARKEFESRFEITPNEIAVRIVVDGSGSMYPDRIEAAKQMAVLFLEAFGSFQETMALRFRLRKPLTVNVEVWIYGSNGAATVIKPFAGSPGAGSEPERVRRFRMIGELGKQRGGTCDGDPLWSIAQSIAPDRRAALKARRSLEFLLAVTDGGSGEASRQGKDLVKDIPQREKAEREGRTFDVFSQAMQDTRNALGEIERAGVIARAFQLGLPPA